MRHRWPICGGILVNLKQIKAVFSEENYVLPTAIVGKHAYCSLLCHNAPSIISRESMHKHNFGQTLKLQSAVFTVNIRSMSLKSYSLFSVSKQISRIYASLVQKKPLVQKTELRKG